MKSMNLMMICFSLFLTGGDIERLARVTEGNIIMPPKRLVAKQKLKQHLKKKNCSSSIEFTNCYSWWTGYSGSDLQALCEEAAMMPIRELGANILTVKANQVIQTCIQL